MVFQNINWETARINLVANCVSVHFNGHSSIRNVWNQNPYRQSCKLCYICIYDRTNRTPCCFILFSFIFHSKDNAIDISQGYERTNIGRKVGLIVCAELLLFVATAIPILVKSDVGTMEAIEFFSMPLTPWVTDRRSFLAGSIELILGQ